jgi:hypothetical protein
MLTPEKFTDVEIAFIASLKEEAALEWADITEKFNKKFRKDKSLDSVKKAYQRNRDRLSDPNNYVKLLKDTARTRKANAINGKDLKTVIDEWNNRDDILDAVKGAIKQLNKVTVKPISLPKPGKHSKGMTLELLISDVHVGKKTQTFDLEVLKRRLKQISDTVVKEAQRAAEHYKIDKIVIALMGDMIESATMHGNESAKACEFGNARQVQECIAQFYHLLLVPIYGLGIEVDVVGVTGNHDRTETHRTYHNPGEENLTWIIYKSLEEMTKIGQFKKVNFFIPINSYFLHSIYGENVLYEHYDNAKGDNLRKALEGLMGKRVNQLKTPIKFMRGGHFHEPAEFGLGKIVVNGSVPGNDSFSDVHGYDCEPSQTLNFYIEREKSDSIKRQTSFYKRFLIQLD